MTDIDEAQKVIAEANQQADLACLEEIREVLKRHRRGLTVTNITLTADGRMLPQITVIHMATEQDND